MSRLLDDLSDRFRPIAFELLARLTEAKIPVLIVDTLRTPEEHKQNLKNRISWTKSSKHLTGDAIDIVPYEQYYTRGENKLQWDPTAPVWQKVGAIGKELGLRWGGDWVQRDMGHFEFVEGVTIPEKRRNDRRA